MNLSEEQLKAQAEFLGWEQPDKERWVVDFPYRPHDNKDDWLLRPCGEYFRKAGLAGWLLSPEGQAALMDKVLSLGNVVGVNFNTDGFVDIDVYGDTYTGIGKPRQEALVNAVLAMLGEDKEGK